MASSTPHSRSAPGRQRHAWRAWQRSPANGRTGPVVRVARVTLAMLGILAVGGCSRPDEPTSPHLEMIGTWPPALKEWLGVADGASSWRWTTSSDGRGGRAELRVAAGGYRWRLQGVVPADLAPADTMQLVPRDAIWHSFVVPHAEALATTPPLPRSAVASAAYEDLVAMLQDWHLPRFAAGVTHWPGYPVPVRSPAAQSGEVDLAACLREAVTIWNEGEAEPWFVWDPQAAWGVRLAHFSGGIRSPPLQIQITRLNDAGQPLAMRINAGDNYQSAASRPYAVRGLAHELGHALLLWGHSPDREHLLWGAAPPLRDDPSPDERRAARLLRLLPAGLDLRRYGRLTEP